MATPENLMGLGMPPFLAERVGGGVTFISAEGATAGAAKQIPGKPGVYVVNAGTSGVALPLVGGDSINSGALLSDSFVIANIAASLVVFAVNNAKGSVVTFYGNGISTAGTTGVSLVSGWQATFRPISVSTWIYTKGSA